jgi:hypothetical protein
MKILKVRIPEITYKRDTMSKILIILIFVFFLPIYLYATSCTVTQVIDGDTFFPNLS